MAQIGQIDALLLLRHALSQDSQATVELQRADGSPATALQDAATIGLQAPDGQLVHLDKAAPTRYTRGDGAAETYDVQTLVLAYLQRDASVPDYLRHAQEQGAGIVSITDRRDVIQWLTSKISVDAHHGRILPLDGAAATSTSAQGSTLASAVAADSATERSADVQAEPSSVATDGGATAAAQPSPAKKQRYVADKADQEAVRRMIELMQGPPFAVDANPGQPALSHRANWAIRDRETALMGQRINNFESVRALVAPRLTMTRDEQEKKDMTAPKDARGGASAVKPAKRKNQDPIIMISPSSTALITMHNVKKFLEDAVFEHSEQARLSGLGATGDVIPITRIRPSTSIASSFGQNPVKKSRFFVVDGVEALAKFGGESAWDRVVCVMTTGQEWQFRPYKWKEPKELFHHVKGVFVQWTTDAPNPKVRNWNVTELRVRYVLFCSTLALFYP
ncbi:accessory factor associated with RNA polymerase II [Microbotryomycetes sp. JL201]|nr:accessory factor associated with RNA polymerase II [Microbotryomycetes sp. JL201]